MSFLFHWSRGFHVAWDKGDRFYSGRVRQITFGFTGLCRNGSTNNSYLTFSARQRLS